MIPTSMHPKILKRRNEVEKTKLREALVKELNKLYGMVDQLESKAKAKLVIRMPKTEETSVKKNCDGCAANMPVVEKTLLGKTVKMHTNPATGRTHMICTAERYNKQK